MSSDEIKIQVQIGDASVSFEGKRTFVDGKTLVGVLDKVIPLLRNASSRSGIKTPSGTGESSHLNDKQALEQASEKSTSGKRIPFPVFLRKNKDKLKSSADFLIYTAFYLRRYRGKDLFSAKELIDFAEEEGGQMYSTFKKRIKNNRKKTMNGLVDKGHFIEVEGDKFSIEDDFYDDMLKNMATDLKC